MRPDSIVAVRQQGHRPSRNRRVVVRREWVLGGADYSGGKNHPSNSGRGGERRKWTRQTRGAALRHGQEPGLALPVAFVET